MSPIVEPGEDIHQEVKNLFVVYAGFWRRAGAILIDGLILFAASLPVKFVFGYGLFPKKPAHQTFFGEGSAESWKYLEYSLVTFVIAWLYFSLMESSRHKATFGKMALNIFVTDEMGNRINFARATGRFFSKIISYITLTIGFMMAGWTKKKQALHDVMARTLVVCK